MCIFEYTAILVQTHLHIEKITAIHHAHQFGPAITYNNATYTQIDCLPFGFCFNTYLSSTLRFASGCSSACYFARTHEVFVGIK